MTQNDREEIIQVINEMGAAVDGEGEVEVINSASQIGEDNVTLPGIKRDQQGNFIGYVVANISLFISYVEDTVNQIKSTWNTWFSTGENNVQSQWEILRTNVQTATAAANTAAEDAETATEAADAATEAAEAATDGAENVDATVNGYVVTVTDRNGDSNSVNLKPDIDAKLDKISEEDFDEIFDSEATEAYKGSWNLVTDLSLTLSATRAQIATALGTAISGEEDGDYAYVMIPFDASRPVYIEHVERYSYNGTAWAFDYVYNRNILDATGDGIFDISAYHAEGGALARYADLEAALGTNGANVPESEQRGGMTVRFVSGVTGEYEQWRLLSDTFSTTVSNWQGVDEEPTARSDNFVSSGGVNNAICNAVKLMSKPIALNDVGLGLALRSKIYMNPDGSIETKTSTTYKLVFLKTSVKKGSVINFTGTSTVSRTNTIAISSVDPSTYEDLTTMTVQVLVSETKQGDFNEDVLVPFDGYIVYSFADSEWSNRNMLLYNYVPSDGVIDMTKLTEKRYTSLSDAIADIPTLLQEGGMSIKFILQEGDNPATTDKYVQYRLTTSEFSSTESDWEGVDDEPKEDSNNIVKSWGVFSGIHANLQQIADMKVKTLLNPYSTENNKVLTKSNKIGAVPVLTSLDGFIVRKYEVDGGGVYTYSLKSRSLSVYFLYWINSDGLIIKYERYGGLNNNVWIDFAVIAPADAAELWMNVRSPLSDYFNFKKVEEDIVSVEEIKYDLSEVTLSILTPYETLDNTLIKRTSIGSTPITGSDNRLCIRKYTVSEGGDYAFSARWSENVTLNSLTWIDSDGNVLKQEYKGKMGVVAIWTDKVVTAPDNAAELWMNVSKENEPYFNFNEADVEMIDVKQLSKDVKNAAKKSIRMLVIGNSYSQDAFAYVPFILKNMGVNVSIQLGILMKSSSSINDHINEWNASASDRSHKGYKLYFHNGGNAWANLGNYNAQDALDEYVWDIIVLQPWHSNDFAWSKYQPAFNQLVNLISDYVAYPVKFTIHQIPMPPASSNGISSDGYNRSDADIISGYEDKALATKLLMEGGEIDGNVILPTVCDAIFPIGTAIQNARTISSLKAMGYYAYHQNNSTNYGYLCSIDGIHLQEGLPCQIAAYTVVLSLLDIYGFKERSVIGETTRVTDAWEEGKSIPGKHPSSVSEVNNFDRLKSGVTVDSVCIGSTDANSVIAQKCAVMAIKRPYEVTDMNYIVNPT